MLTEACRLATTAALNLSGTPTVDGITTAVGDRVLVKNQTTTRDNGIYVVRPLPAPWMRAKDFDSSAEVKDAFVPVVQGRTNAATLWRLTQAAWQPVVIGTTPLTFERADPNGVFFRPLVPRALTRTAQDKMRDVVSVKDFGAAGDDRHDDTEEIQAAIGSGAKAIYFPEGTYRVSAPITVPAGVGMRLFGAGFKETVLKASAAVESILNIGAGEQTTWGTVEDMMILAGESLVVKYGIYGARVDHFTFRRIFCQGFQEAGISVGYGWCNNFLESEFSDNNGHGLELNIHHGSGGNNGVNIRDCVFLKNLKHGIFVRSAMGLSIDGCTIEKNEGGGIFIANCEAFSISSYFETNAATGYLFLDPPRRVHADIILCGAGTPDVMANPYPCRGGVISNCVVSSNVPAVSPDADPPVFIYDAGAVDCAVRNCARAVPEPPEPDSGLPVLVRWEYRPSHRGYNWTVENCSSFKEIFHEVHDRDHGGTDPETTGSASWSARTRMLPRQADLRRVVQRRNYANLDLNTWILLSAGSASTYRKSPKAELQFWNGLAVWSIESTAADTSDVFGMRLPAADYPDLVGKLMWFGIWKHAPDGATAFALPYCNRQPFTDSPSSTAWEFEAASFVWPAPSLPPDAPAFVDCGICKTGTGTGTIYFTAPMLMEVGTPLDEALQTIPQLPYTWRGTAAPTAGMWKVGDTVLNSEPGPGSALGWVCTGAGVPGTWKAMSNLAP
ncbi:MAG: glycosyl hydrolase family 28-related protein [Vicinamibacterales bacterium]